MSRRDLEVIDYGGKSYVVDHRNGFMWVLGNPICKVRFVFKNGVVYIPYIPTWFESVYRGLFLYINRKYMSVVPKEYREGDIEVNVFPDLEVWEFYNHENDDHVSGCFFCDDEDPKRIIDYDGVFQLPDIMYRAFVDMGYNVDEIR